MGAFFFALTATRTLIFIKHHLRTKVLTFGIVAPYAAQIASLEEHCGSYSRAVSDRKMLYVEYISRRNADRMDITTHYKPFFLLFHPGPAA